MSVFEPLEHQKTPTAVYSQIRAAILSGSLPAGSQLREAYIATDMGISRSPLREALSRLEEEGLVEKRPFKGAFVSTVSPEDIAEIASLRALLEPYAVELALPRLSEAHWQQVADILSRLSAATESRDGGEQIDAHLSFHGYFYEHCGHKMLAGLWHTWESKLRLFLVDDHESFSDPHDVAGVHETLVDEIRSGDLERIKAALLHHIHGSIGQEAGDPMKLAIPPAETVPTKPKTVKNRARAQ